MEDINGAINYGVQLTHNEQIGYTMGATLANSNETDCSDFVWYCLKNNGFNVPSTRWSTQTMIPYLQQYEGFTEYIYTDGFIWQHGDIAVYDEGAGANGHTFFYAENVQGFTSEDDSEGTTILNRARVEASSSHGHIGNGDSRKNGVGAYWEVWTHQFYFTTNNHTWHIFRWNGGPPPTPARLHKMKLPVWLMSDIQKKRG